MDVDKKLEDYELWHNAEPKCPYCGHDNYVEAEDLPSHDGDELDIECSNCEKEFKIVMNIEVTFYSYK